MQIMRAIVFGLLAMLGLAQPVIAVEISRVSHQPGNFVPEKGERVSIGFTVSEPAQVTVKLYDGRDLLIRNIVGQTLLKSGEHTMVWNGKDEAGNDVPPEAYRYTIVATGSDGKEVEHDLTDYTGGETVTVKDVRWNKETGQIQYVLPKPARVHVRLGIGGGGPYMRGLLDWVPRTAGAHKLPWDGMDESGLVNLSSHPRLDLTVMAFSLSDNVIVVGPEKDAVQLIEPLSWAKQKRPIKKVRKKRMVVHAQQPIETRGTLTVRLELPQIDGTTENGIPIVSGQVPVRLVVDQQDQSRLLERGFEPIFFLDGLYMYENEVGFLPITWQWNAEQTNEGEHYITANVRSYEGNFGTATVKVRVHKPKEKVRK